MTGFGAEPAQGIESIRPFWLTKETSGTHEREVGVRIAIVGNELQLRTDIAYRSGLEICLNHKVQHAACHRVGTLSLGRRIDQSGSEVSLRDFLSRHVAITSL
jgi:hypothetical protein